MRKLLVSLLAVLSIGLASCTQKDNRKILVVYFSATGNTAEAAKKLAEVTDGALYEIVPEQPYTKEDIDYDNKQSRCWVENDNPEFRPGIKNENLNVADYDLIFIGYPIWWEKAPLVVNTFIESYDLKGKTLISFGTSATSKIDGSATALKNTYPDLTWKKGKILNGMNEEEIKEWVEDKNDI